MIYHISGDGVPRPCRATKACPIGGAHFQSKLSAIAYLEAEALKDNGGSFQSNMDRDQRYRLARSNELPTMSYNQKIGDAVYDRYGNAWEIESSSPAGSNPKPVITLKRVKDNKIITLDPKNEVQKFDTAVHKDIDTGEYGFKTVLNYLTRKETGNWTIRDFYKTVPEPIVLDKPAVRSSKKYSPLATGITQLTHAAVRHVNVHTSVDKPVESRWLVVDRASTADISPKEHREITKAAYEQTGRALSSFAKLSDFQKSEFANFDWRPVRITNDGDNIVLEHYSDTNNIFQLTGEAIKPEDITLYNLRP